jgi:hypothetical protein
MHGGSKTPIFRRFSRGVTRLVSDRAHAKTPATELEHLGHEGQSIDAPSLVERGKYLFLAADLDEITGAVA